MCYLTRGQFAILGSLAALLLIAIIYLSPEFGYQDFIQYYTANHCLENGLNPYLPQNMLLAQKNLGDNRGFPTMMWNPPWLLIYLKPFLVENFSISFQLWSVAQIVLILGSLFTLANHFQVSVLKILPAALLLPVPLIRLLESGQIASLLCLFTTLTYIACCRRKWFATGIFLSALSVKPHLFIILGFVLIWFSLSSKNYKLIYGSLVGLLAQVSLAALLFGWDIIVLWFDSLLHAPEGAPSLAEWRGVTVPQLIRLFYNSITPLIVVPILTFIGIIFTLNKAKNYNLDFYLIFPTILGLSVLSSIYGWPADLALLLPLAAKWITDRPQSKFIVLTATFLSISSMLSYFTFMVYEHTYGYWAAALFVLAAFDFYKESSKLQFDSIGQLPQSKGQ